MQIKVKVGAIMDINNFINSNETENPVDGKLFENISNNDDGTKLEVLIGKIKNYDIYDFLNRLSALYLLPENQNKGVLIDALIQAILYKDKSKFNSKTVMSSRRFKNLIHELEKLSLKLAIDPAENAFVENVMYYDNYLIFPGIEYTPAYCLQQLINTLRYNMEKYDKEYLARANKIILFCLQVTNDVAQKENYSIELLEHIEVNEIKIPDSNTLRRLKNHLVIDSEKVVALLGEKDDENAYSDFKENDLNKVLTAQYHQFLFSPFIKIDDDKSLILNISALGTFAIQRILMLSKEYDFFRDLMNDYNEVVWRNVKSSFERLGHRKLSLDQFGLSPLNESFYKDTLLSVYNNQIFVVHFICDDGKELKQDNFYGLYSFVEVQDTLNYRLKEVFNKLKDSSVNLKDIYQIYIVNMLGRSIQIQLPKVAYFNPIQLNPYELSCIAINESKEEAFLPKYIKSKNKLLPSFNYALVSELNSIEIYVNSDYSFYLNDDFNPKTTFLYVVPGDSIEYIIRALKKELRHLVNSYSVGRMSEVFLTDHNRKMYTDMNFSECRSKIFIEFSNLNLWVYSVEVDNFKTFEMYASFVDTLTYWLYECGLELIEKGRFVKKSYNILLELEGNIDDCYLKKDDVGTWNDYVEINRTLKGLHIIFEPAAFRLFAINSSKTEYEMIKTVLEALVEDVFDAERPIINLSKYFINPFKKKFYTMDFMKEPYLKSTLNKGFRKLSKEDENDLLNQIGLDVLENMECDYGVLPDHRRREVSNHVVGFLYKQLCEELSTLESTHIIEEVYLDLENVMYQTLLSRQQYLYETACYPDKKDGYNSKINELSKSSIAMKFLIEYVTACPPSGTIRFGESHYQRLLAICLLIIEWAYKNDLFYYDVINTHIEILKSDRLGLQKDEIEKLSNIMFSAREVELNYMKDESASESIYDWIEDFEEKLDQAFKEENGFTFSDFTAAVMFILELGNKQESEVKVMKINEVINQIDEHITSFDKDTALNFIDYISLKERDGFFKLDKKYRKEDVYPWRFNRENSFTRRPVIIRGDEIVWGNRQLFHMIRFTIDLIYNGKLKCRKNKMKKLISRISNYTGASFNNKVYSKIDSVEGINAFSNVKKVGETYICNAEGNTLGDIDVLFFNEKTKVVVLAEVKNFNLSKNPYEMHMEYKKMFVDEGNKKSFFTKHKNRRVWVEENLEHVLSSYSIESKGWSVKEIFVVSEPLISRDFYNKQYNIYTYNELTEDLIKGIK